MSDAGNIPNYGKAKGSGKFGGDALYMNLDLFGSIIQQVWYIYTNKYLFILSVTF